MSPSPPRTKSYGIPDHSPGRPGYALRAVWALSYWNPIQSGDSNPSVSYGATATTPRPNRRDSTRNRPWNAMSSSAKSLMYHRSTSSRYPWSDGGDSGPVEVAHVHDHEWSRDPRDATHQSERIGERRRPGRGSRPSVVARAGRRATRRWSQHGQGGRGRRRDGASEGMGTTGGDVDGELLRRIGAVARDERRHQHARDDRYEEPTQRNTPHRPGDAPRIPIAPILGRTGGHARPRPPQRRGARRRPPAPRQPSPLPPAIRHGRRRRRAVLVHRRRVIRSVAPSPTTSIDTRWPIKQVIYVMMENRSFDNVFGRFPGVNGTTIGVKWGEETPLIRCPDWLPGRPSARPGGGAQLLERRQARRVRGRHVR